MPSEIIAALIGLSGVIIGSVPTYLYLKQKYKAEIEKSNAEAGKFRAEAEKSSAEAEKFRAETEKTRSEISIRVGKDVEKSLDSITIKSSSLLKTRAQLPDFAKLVSSHDEIWIAGKDVYGLTDENKKVFLAAKQERKNYRIIIVASEAKHLIKTITASSVTHPTVEKRTDFARFAFRHLEELHLACPENIEIRLANFLPTCSFVILDGKQSNGEMYIELYGYKISTRDRLHVHLKRIDDKDSFDFFLHQFEEMWRNPDNKPLV
jgi:hypothetical protein